MIISVGYRVKSKRGVMFRKWATSVLRDYLVNGVVVNEKKITKNYKVGDKNNLVKFVDGSFEIDARFDNVTETMWLTQKQISELFEKDQSVISRHIKNSIQDEEIDEKRNMQKMHIANSDKLVTIYDLDVIIAIGYRVKSKRGVMFRKWATNVLREYLINGVVVNEKKITKY